MLTGFQGSVVAGTEIVMNFPEIVHNIETRPASSLRQGGSEEGLQSVRIEYAAPTGAGLCVVGGRRRAGPESACAWRGGRHRDPYAELQVESEAPAS